MSENLIPTLYFDPQEELVSVFPRKGTEIANFWTYGNDWIDEQGVVHNSDREPLVSQFDQVTIAEGTVYVDKDLGVLHAVGYKP